MKTTLTLLIFTLLCSLQVAAQNHKDYYPNGNLKEIGELDKSKHIGVWKYYHENGQLSAEGKYDLNGDIILGTWTTYNEKGAKEGCDCPKPTQVQITEVCHAVYGNKFPIGEILGNKYEEDLWKMSCADPLKDSPEVAKIKIQCMWNKYKEEFSCNNFSGVSLRGANILKFSIDVGYEGFIVVAIKRYGLDVNFIDPVDGKTLLDFMEWRMKSYRDGGWTEKVDEYQRIYDLLIKYGAKHANEL